VRVCLPLLFLATALRFSHGQVLFTGETSGKGASSVFIAGNVSRVRDFTTPANFWTAYTRGLHTRVDGFGFYGNLTIFGQTQHYAGFGSSIGILQRTRHVVDLAFVSFFSTPINHRDRAATVSVVLAPVASRPVQVGRYRMTLYTGYLRGESLGQRADKLFSAPAATHNGIVGTVLPLSKSLFLIAEYDPGHGQQNLGLAVLYMLPRN
jgi:hypothetical protein